MDSAASQKFETPPHQNSKFSNFPPPFPPFWLIRLSSSTFSTTSTCLIMKIQAFLERLHLDQCDVTKIQGPTPLKFKIFPPSPPLAIPTPFSVVVNRLQLQLSDRIFQKYYAAVQAMCHSKFWGPYPTRNLIPPPSKIYISCIHSVIPFIKCHRLIFLLAAIAVDFSSPQRKKIYPQSPLPPKDFEDFSKKHFLAIHKQAPGYGFEFYQFMIWLSDLNLSSALALSSGLRKFFKKKFALDDMTLGFEFGFYLHPSPPLGTQKIFQYIIFSNS